MPDADITHFYGRAGDVVWNRIKNHLHLLTDGKRLAGRHRAGWYDGEVRARMLTFLQILAFGDDGKHHARYGSKLGRNQYLASIDPHIIGLSLEENEQILSIETNAGVTFECSLGRISGASVVYPLNARAVEAYRANRLPPHLFRRAHLRRRAKGAADGVFLGAALYLPSLHRLLTASEDFVKDEPSLLADCIGKQVLHYLPEVRLTRRDGDCRLTTCDSRALPRLYTAFSNRGQGEELVQRIGFTGDLRHPHQAILGNRRHLRRPDLGDRRYVLDLNDFNAEMTPSDRKRKILEAWGWFLQWSDSTASARLSRGLKEAALAMSSR